jgi:ABC-2 type transport system permease protein
VTATTYVRYEMLRAARNIRFFTFSLVFPLLLFFLVASPNRHEHIDGVAFPVYYMTGMVAWGTMAAVIASGGRIAAERAIGWNRQLRVTPLRARDYLLAKAATGYAVALVSVAILYAAGVSLGVRLPVEHWLGMTVMILIGLVPFAVLGIYLGHVLTPESMGPALGGITALFALLGGAWGPIATSGFLHTLSECLPSYWLVQAGKLAEAGGPWPARAWLVFAVWTLALGWLAARAWRRDTGRA